jgi:AAA family ATP:ADP antiporter
MFHSADTRPPVLTKSPLDRLLSLFAQVHAGEGRTALLMLLNVFVLLVCYSVIKTVREPLILLGGGAEVRSYASAGQALLLIGFVPLYSWFATRVGRARLLVGVTVFFLAGIELFAALVGAGVPYIGVAFFIWVGIFNMSLVAQFWSFANDIYSKEAGTRIFPIIMVGMTAGAPLGSLVAGRLFRSGLPPAAILHVAAALLAASLLLYLAINARVTRQAAAPRPLLDTGGGFQLVLRNPYLRLIAALVVILNVVNTTGEYLMARLLTAHVDALAALTAGFDKQAYIGAFSGEYQFWVNVAALVLQAFVASRVVKHRGLQGALLALPLIALGGYAIIAAGATFSVVRWIKTAENATDYSLMNTARQLLWLPTSREDKYKAKQAIDTFFVRGGDLVSALVVFAGVKVMHLTVEQFAIVNVALTLVWVGLAFRILDLRPAAPRVSRPVLARTAFATSGRFATRLAALASRSASADRPACGAAVVIALLVTVPAFAQETRHDQVAAEQADKATRLHAYMPDALERRLHVVEKVVASEWPIYIGSVFEGGGMAFGPRYRASFADSGSFDAHAAWSVKSNKGAQASLKSPSFAGGRVTVRAQAKLLDVPEVGFYGIGNDTLAADRAGYAYSAQTVGLSMRVQASRALAFGAGMDAMWLDAGSPAQMTAYAAASPTYARSHVFGEVDTRTSPGYTRRGGLYRVDWSNYQQTNRGSYSFDRVDAEAQQFIPLLRENWVIALRALASHSGADAGDEVPHFLMPSLGGSRTLRGYPAWRFRDRNRVLITGEYRWTAGPFVDMALFLDAGKVTARAADLASGRFTRTYGAGVTLHTLTSTLTRFEVARTPDGTSLLLSFGPSF